MSDIRGDTKTEKDNLLTPRFDEDASANAQPVTPIPRSPIEVLVDNGRKLFAGGSSLALIVLLGVATGTLAGMAMVREQQSMPAPAEEQASVLTDSNAVPAVEAVEVGAYGVQPAETTVRKAPAKRLRVPADGRPRAYRFAVIR